jgi:hypothetical protein
MRIIIFIACTLLLTSCFGNTSNDKNNSLKSNNPEVIESFDEFIRKFYSDTSFQMNRIITPLKGDKKFWDDNEDIIVTTNWEEKEIPKITSFDKIHESLNKTIQDIVKEESRVMEKIYIPNSGFYLNRTFEMQNNKWYLVRYDISDI